MIHSDMSMIDFINATYPHSAIIQTQKKRPEMVKALTALGASHYDIQFLNRNIETGDFIYHLRFSEASDYMLAVIAFA